MKTIDERMSEKRERAEALQAMEMVEVRVYEAAKKLEQMRDAFERAEAEHAAVSAELRAAETKIIALLARAAKKCPLHDVIDATTTQALLAQNAAIACLCSTGPT